MTPSTIAVTGATGFVGGAVLDAALAAGHRVRALVRRAQPPRAGVDWITGALDDPAALATLMAGADAVLHIAGAVNVPTRAAFAAANIAGTRAVVEAAAAADVPRFVHISSLAAREPALSNYGWSKAGAEDVVRTSSLDWVIIRPPAIYGPRDMDMLELFKMARTGLMLLPPAGRLSVIYVMDLADLLVQACMTPALDSHRIYEVDDGAVGGITHQALATAIARAVGRPRAVMLSAPAWAVGLAARADQLVRGPRARLTPDRARYMVHPDWVANPALMIADGVWVPATPLTDGLAATVHWYQTQGLIAAAA